MIGQSLRQALTENGLTVDWVKDGVLAQDALAQGGYAAVLLDLGLPRRSGLEVLRRARQDGDRTPMLVLTARTASTIASKDWMSARMIIWSSLSRCASCSRA